jgi:hypothetical protein
MFSPLFFNTDIFIQERSQLAKVGYELASVLKEIRPIRNELLQIKIAELENHMANMAGRRISVFWTGRQHTIAEVPS